MRFAGYAAVFDRPDSGGDIVRKGAFTGAKKPLPLLWQHDPHKRIGTVDYIEEDARGLRMKATLDTARDLSPGHGLSFGYRVRKARTGTFRELTNLELIEISLVTQPMQPLARVLAVEADGAAQIPSPLVGEG